MGGKVTTVPTASGFSGNVQQDFIHSSVLRECSRVELHLPWHILP